MTISAPVPVSPEHAAELVEDIRTAFESAQAAYSAAYSLLGQAHDHRIWEALGLPDWAAFVAYTLDVDNLEIPRVERAAIVADLPSVPKGTLLDRWLSALPEDWRLGVREFLALTDGAREAFRTGEPPVPPEWWRPSDGTALHESDRVNLWAVLCMCGVGDFLNWCRRVGVIKGTRSGRLVLNLPERLTYPLDAEHLSEGFDDAAAHLASVGRLVSWLGPETVSTGRNWTDRATVA